VTSQN
jgi:dynein heavy chain